MRYWNTYQKKLIRKYLTAVFEEKLNFNLWQQFGDRKQQYDAKFSSMEQDKIKVQINKADLKENGELLKDQPLFVHIPVVDLIFKKDKFNYYVNQVDFPMPNNIRIHERRKVPRFEYKYQDHKNITFYMSYHSDKDEQGVEKFEPEKNYSCVLIDIATAGASMVVSKDTYHELTVGQTIFLQSITDQVLPTPFKSKIMYMKRYNEEGSSHTFKIGIGFDDELDSISYKSITSIVEVKQKKISGLDPSRFCGLDYEEQVRTLYQIEATNPVLANNIRDNLEYLDRLRYMTTQMKIEFLQTVQDDLLATALRLSSKELIYDLLIELTANMRAEFLDKLEIEKPASGICNAQDQIVAIIKEKEGTGEYILDPLSFTTYV